MKPYNLDAIENQVANSSEKNRNFFTTTLVVFVYIAIVVLQTSDLDLLLGRNIKLPIVNIDMPMFAFYIAAPFLVLALHFNLLQNIENHYAKLCVWRNNSVTQQIQRSNIYPFIFDFAMLDESSVLINITRLVNQIVIFWSGPITLLLILWRFTDYQSLNVTLWHFICLLANLWLVSRCRQVIFGRNKDNIKAVESESFEIWSKIKHRLIKLLSYSSLIFTWCVKDSYNHMISNLIGIFLWLSALAQLCLLMVILNSKLSQIDLLKYQLPELLLARINIAPEENLLALDEKNLKLQFELDDRDFSILEFERLYEGDKKLTPHTYSFYEWFILHGVGLDLRGRSFRLASLRYADLRRARLNNAVLTGADLYSAKLQGADLTSAQLQGAIFNFASLQRAGLVNINFDKSTSFFNCNINSDTSLFISEVGQPIYKENTINNKLTEKLLIDMRKQGCPK